MRMIIIRHCLANSKLDDGFYGKKNYPLSKEGKKQAKKLASFLKNEHVDMIFSSPQKRAYFTALEIAKAKSIDVSRTELLKEVDFGTFEGMTTNEAKLKMPKTFFERERNKFNFTIPNGESYKSAYDRAMAFINSISSEHAKTIVIVTHATMIKLLLMGLAKMSLKDVESHFFPNGSVTKLAINGKTKIELFNYTGYL
jgi:alpha-ribazole phosphatase